MTVQELIDKLSECDRNMQIMILERADGLQPRTINVGPFRWDITDQNGDDNCDCEELIEKNETRVVVIGYGSY